MSRDRSIKERYVSNRRIGKITAVKQNLWYLWRLQPTKLQGRRKNNTLQYDTNTKFKI